MFNALARSVAVGVFAVGPLLGTPGVAFAQPHGGGGDGDAMDIVGAHDGAQIIGSRPGSAVPSQSNANEVAVESVTIAVESIEKG